MVNENKNYNGWYNYETWLMALNINNEEGLQDSVNEYIEEYIRDFLDETMQIYILANRLKDYIEEFADGTTQVITLSDSFDQTTQSAIDWYEIAETFLSDYLNNMLYKTDLRVVKKEVA